MLDIFDKTGRFVGAVHSLYGDVEVAEAGEIDPDRLHPVDARNVICGVVDEATARECAALLKAWEPDLDDLEVRTHAGGYAVYRAAAR